MFVPLVAGVLVNANAGSTAKGIGGTIPTVAGIAAVTNGVRGNNATDIKEEEDAERSLSSTRGPCRRNTGRLAVAAAKAAEAAATHSKTSC